MADSGKIVRKGKGEHSSNFDLFSPIDGKNIGAKSFKIKEIFYMFKNRYNHITSKNFEKS